MGNYLFTSFRKNNVNEAGIRMEAQEPFHLLRHFSASVCRKEINRKAACARRRSRGKFPDSIAHGHPEEKVSRADGGPAHE